MNHDDTAPASLPRLRPRRALGALLGVALAGAACNSVLGIDEASLCSTACDAGPPDVRGSTAPNLPGTGRADAGSDAGLSLSGGNDGVIVPGATPVDSSGTNVGAGNSGSGNSGSNSGSDNSGRGNGDGNDDGDDSNGDGSDGNDSDGDGSNGDGSNGNGDDNSGPGGGTAGAGGAGGQGTGGTPGGAGAGGQTPTEPPPPPPPPPSPCDGRAEGEVFCDGATRISCGAGGSVLGGELCISDAHCLQGVGPTCATCLAGEARCEGASLIACNAQRSGLDTIPCAGPAQCNAAAARCETPVCAPNQVVCNGASLQRCNATLTGFDPLADCGAPEACNAQAAACNVCVPGARRCFDAITVATCDPTGQVETPSGCGLLGVCQDGECITIGVPGL